MRTKHPYKTEEDRLALLAWGEAQGLFLIEDAIRLKEKYLIYDTFPAPPFPLPLDQLLKLKVNEMIDAIKIKDKEFPVEKIK